MPETPEELYERVAKALVMPPVEEWETFPFDGEMRPRVLQPPVEAETPRFGTDGIDCDACETADDAYLWVSERWRLRSLGRPAGLPDIVLLEPRAHIAEPGDLSEEMASELGLLIARIERAVRSVADIGRVHVCRWGDGGEHLHWWFIARPARIQQLLGSFAPIWDDILPPVPEEIWQANLEHIAHALAASS